MLECTYVAGGVLTCCICRRSVSIRSFLEHPGLSILKTKVAFTRFLRVAGGEAASKISQLTCQNVHCINIRGGTKFGGCYVFQSWFVIVLQECTNEIWKVFVPWVSRLFLAISGHILAILTFMMAILGLMLGSWVSSGPSWASSWPS